MKNVMKRGAALLIALLLCIGFVPTFQLHANAETTTAYVYNWGERGELATELSSMAEAFYASQSTSYNELSSYTGGTGASNAPNSDLYDVLQDLMQGAHHKQNDYDEAKNYFMYTDCQNGGGKISSFYSGTPIGPSWDGGWNREHTWPDSKGLNDRDEDDIMMLRPTSTSENSSRGNTAYGKSGGYYDPNRESNHTLNLHGDVARIFLYVYVRWGNTQGNSKYGTVWGTDGVFESLDVLLAWMEEDPVDTWELGRNDSVQSITGTRNVFVDYPELAFQLFGREIPAEMSTPSRGEAEKCEHNVGAGVVTPPTCTLEGFTTYTCTLCGISYTGNKTSALGHNYVNGACLTCGAAKPTITTQSISFATTANRTEFNTSQQVWVQNGITITNIKGSSSSAVADYANPARFYKGSSVKIEYPDMTKIEIDCTGIESKYVSAWVNDARSAGTSVINENNIITLTFIEPIDSYTFNGLSAQSRANTITVHGAAAETQCEHTNTRIEGASAATCTVNGHTGVTRCVACGAVVDAGSVILAKHSEVPHEGLNPSCTEKGWTEYVTCSKCSYTTYEEIAALGHADGNGDALCDRCGTEINSENPPADTPSDPPNDTPTNPPSDPPADTPSDDPSKMPSENTEEPISPTGTVIAVGVVAVSVGGVMLLFRKKKL